MFPVNNIINMSTYEERYKKKCTYCGQYVSWDRELRKKLGFNRPLQWGELFEHPCPGYDPKTGWKGREGTYKKIYHGYNYNIIPYDEFGNPERLDTYIDKDNKEDD